MIKTQHLVWFFRAVHLAVPLTIAGFLAAGVVKGGRWWVWSAACSWGVIATQIAFLGCPLTAIEASLTGGPAYPQQSGSFMVWLLHKFFGVVLPSWAVTAATVIIFMSSVAGLIAHSRKTPILETDQHHSSGGQEQGAKRVFGF